jgi:acrylyl-CoA reductase (NADPH)
MTSLPASFHGLRVTGDRDAPVAALTDDLGEADLGDGDVLIRVSHSSANYKDLLAITPRGGVVRSYPIVPGIDLAGTVVHDRSGAWQAGAQVLAHGYGIGTEHGGGFAEYARVPADQVVARGGLSAHDAMALGTAGFTAAMSVDAVLAHGVVPGDGPVLVTGAGGGVGMVAVDLLAARGFHVVASTGSATAPDRLRALGAAEIVGRFPEDPDAPIRPLGTATWSAVVDSVGGRSLAAILGRVAYGGIVAASGLTGGAELPTTVMPFILRAVTLRGIDSVQLDIAARRALWARLSGDLAPAHLDAWSTERPLDDVLDVLDAIRGGRNAGRVVLAV